MPLVDFVSNCGFSCVLSRVLYPTADHMPKTFKDRHTVKRRNDREVRAEKTRNVKLY